MDMPAVNNVPFCHRAHPFKSKKAPGRRPKLVFQIIILRSASSPSKSRRHSVPSTPCVFAPTSEHAPLPRCCFTVLNLLVSYVKCPQGPDQVLFSKRKKQSEDNK